MRRSMPSSWRSLDVVIRDSSDVNGFADRVGDGFYYKHIWLSNTAEPGEARDFRADSQTPASCADDSVERQAGTCRVDNLTFLVLDRAVAFSRPTPAQE